MSRLDELPPDQRATLSLLLRQRKSYAEVATLLGIAERAVHDRAQAALVMLAPRQARELAPEHRLEIGDYLLGQQPGVAERLRTRTYLSSAPPARAWASELAAQLAQLAGDGLPEIPAATQEPQRLQDLTPLPPSSSSSSPPAGAAAAAGAPPPAATQRALPSSRAGGAVLLAVIVAAVIVAVVLLSGGGSSHPKSSASTGTGSSTKTGPSIDNQITLKAPSSKSASVGVVDVVSEGDKRVFLIEAQHIPESKGFYYAIWLYDSPTKALPLSRSPAVGSTHRLAGGAPLPSNAGEYHEILLTEETKSKPSHPGRVVLRGPFSLSG